MQFDIIGMFSFIADILTLIFLINYYKLIKKNIFTILLVWSIISVAIDFFAVFSTEKFQQLISFYSIMLEVVVVGFLYYFIVHKKLYKYIIVIATIGFLIFSFIQWNDMGNSTFSTWLASIAVFFTLALSLLAFVDLFLEVKNDFLLELPAIWLVFAYMIYAAGNLFLFATTESFKSIFIEPGFWRIFFIANIIKNLFFIKAIVLQNKNMKQIN